MDSLVLPFDFPCKGDFVYDLLSAFVLHVLYVRGVLPEPFEGLHQIMLAEEAGTSADALKYSDRKRRKSIHDIMETLAVIRSLANGVGIERVAVLLGPSANNPKETYIVDFDHQPLNSVGNIVSTKQVSQAKRHLIHKLIEHQSTEDSPPPTKANVFFAIKLAESADESNVAALQSEELLRVFSFRESFRIKHEIAAPGTLVKKSFGGRKKAKPFHLSVVSKSAEVRNTVINLSKGGVDHVDGPGLAESSVEMSSPTHDGMWLVLSKGIKTISV